MMKSSQFQEPEKAADAGECNNWEKIEADAFLTLYAIFFSGYLSRPL